MTWKQLLNTLACQGYDFIKTTDNESKTYSVSQCKSLFSAVPNPDETLLETIPAPNEPNTLLIYDLTVQEDPTYLGRAFRGVVASA